MIGTAVPLAVSKKLIPMSCAESMIAVGIGFVGLRAEVHGAEAQPGNLQAGPAKVGVLHIRDPSRWFRRAELSVPFGGSVPFPVPHPATAPAQYDQGDGKECSGTFVSMTLRKPFQLIKFGSLLALLVGTAILYLWWLTASGYANSFYSAAAQAGSMDWTAFLFGSLDPGNSITVDKPPASLWLMALSVRLFGLSSASILVPQALLGVGTVGVLYATVRRTSGHWAGLAAGVILALTPAAALMFRFNNPDALLVFLMTRPPMRPCERSSGRGRWLVLAGALIGFAFLTKMLQAFLVLPAFVIVYLIAAPTRLRTRLLHLLAAFAAMIVSLGWWVALVELMPDNCGPNRWLPRQLGARIDLRLQRARPVHRRTDRKRRRRRPVACGARPG